MIKINKWKQFDFIIQQQQKLIRKKTADCSMNCPSFNPAVLPIKISITIEKLIIIEHLQIWNLFTNENFQTELNK